jgi:hypothetical protein
VETHRSKLRDKADSHELPFVRCGKAAREQSRSPMLGLVTRKSRPKDRDDHNELAFVRCGTHKAEWKADAQLGDSQKEIARRGQSWRVAVRAVWRMQAESKPEARSSNWQKQITRRSRRQ